MMNIKLIPHGFRSGFMTKSALTPEHKHALLGGLGGSVLGGTAGYFLGDDEKNKLADIILGSGFGGVGGAGLGYLYGGARKNKETYRSKEKDKARKETKRSK